VAKTHYEALGVAATSTAAEIRSAYRKLVMQHHPDRSADPKSKSIFLAASEAYEVLGDNERRRDYDSRLEIEGKLNVRRMQAKAKAAHTAQTPSGKLAEIKLDINRLNTLYSRGNTGEAEKLALNILERDRRQPIPYAILGDLAKQRGDKKRAITMYANAIQFDPRNPVYRQRYEELVDSPLAPSPAPPAHSRPSYDQKTTHSFAPLFGLGLIVVACTYIVMARETPLFPAIGFISTWTTGIIAMLFFGGVVLGSCLALDGMLQSYSSTGAPSQGVSPTVALATIAVVSFWAAVAMYALIGAWRKSFNTSTTRVLASVAVATCMLAIAAEASNSVSGLQVALWGGNLVYLGAICGWMVTDALRAA